VASKRLDPSHRTTSQSSSSCSTRRDLRAPSAASSLSCVPELSEDGSSAYSADELVTPPHAMSTMSLPDSDVSQLNLSDASSSAPVDPHTTPRVGDYTPSPKKQKHSRWVARICSSLQSVKIKSSRARSRRLPLIAAECAPDVPFAMPPYSGKGRFSHLYAC
jgi:hypothetical protein